MSDLTVANTILMQLGGNKFIVCTGCNHFVGDNDSLRMRIGRNKSSANRLKITLTPADLYTMEFTRETMPHFDKKMVWHEGKTKLIKKYEDVFFDQLQELFTEVTGLYTHL